MPRPGYKFHYIYKTTNIVNGKFYFGMHSTNNLNDGYKGSGQMLWHSIKKYGKENFKTEILEFYPDRKTLRDREKEIVNSKLILDDMCMNLVEGGVSGFEQNHSEDVRKKISKSLSKPYSEIYGELAFEQKEKRKNGALKQWKNFSIEQKQKINEKISEKLKETYKTNPPVSKKLTCPHCGKEGNGNVMYKHHFDKCKQHFKN